MTEENNKVGDRIIRKKELLNMIGLSDSTVWRMENKGEFPIRLRIGKGCGWLESEIHGWIKSRSEEREVL